jgi:hypothetical protein
MAGILKRSPVLKSAIAWPGRVALFAGALALVTLMG